MIPDWWICGSHSLEHEHEHEITAALEPPGCVDPDLVATPTPARTRTFLARLGSSSGQMAAMLPTPA